MLLSPVSLIVLPPVCLFLPVFFSALYSLSSLFLPSLVGWGGVGDPFFHYLSGLPGHPGCHISSRKGGGDGTFWTCDFVEAGPMKSLPLVSKFRLG